MSNQQIIDFYAKTPLDLFINVSESEGIPVSIMEAMSFGIPAIATNVGGTNEIVNQKNGYLIDSESTSEEISNYINNFLYIIKNVNINYKKYNNILFDVIETICNINKTEFLKYKKQVKEYYKNLYDICII